MGSTLASVIAVVAVVVAIIAITVLGNSGSEEGPAMTQSEAQQVETNQTAETSSAAMTDEEEAASTDNTVDVVLDDVQPEVPQVATTSGFSPVGNVLAGSDVPFVEFNRTDYEAALAANQNVVLYFYANWCPTCKKELREATQPAFDQLSGIDNVVGFRVNYNDNETDSFERDLARQFGVAYQHTKVLLNTEGERVSKNPQSWDTSEYIAQITSLATQ